MFDKYFSDSFSKSISKIKILLHLTFFSHFIDIDQKINSIRETMRISRMYDTKIIRHLSEYQIDSYFKIKIFAIKRNPA